MHECKHCDERFGGPKPEHPGYHYCEDCKRSQRRDERLCEECGSRRFWTEVNGPVTDYSRCFQFTRNEK
jgi:DNA-directed RNA polymerase subunit RPC12/RpoP